jgi:hypothetical protein
MDYIQQSADSIRLYFSDGNPNINQFKILKSDSVFFGDLTINYGILGESHFVQVAKNGLTRTEICACVEGKFNSSDQVIFKSLIKDLPDASYDIERLNYSFTYKKLLGKDAKKQLSLFLLDKDSKDVNYLQQNFKARFFFLPKAITAIKVQYTGNTVSVETVHTYPNENTSVFTYSSFTT